jgi:hypothetical protein
MFLSNLRFCLVLTAAAAAFFSACGGSQGNANAGFTPATAEKGEYPFSVREPEAYRAEVVITTGETEERYFIARKGDRWRRDHYRAGRPAITELGAGAAYVLDHRTRTYSQEPVAGETIGPDPAALAFFRGKKYYDFDEVSREAGVIRYKVRKGENLADDILISIDEASGMIIRQEFTSVSGESFLYELHDLSLEVDDSVFALPAGYRKVDWPAFSVSLAKEK